MPLKILSPIQKIIYIENGGDTQELVSFLLKLKNYEVVRLKNYQDVLPLVRTMRFNLLVMADWMPGRSGIDLCESVRTFDSNTPILFAAGAAFDRDGSQALSSDALGYLIKPDEYNGLIDEVARLISEASTGKWSREFSSIETSDTLNMAVDNHRHIANKRKATNVENERRSGFACVFVLP